MAKFIGEIGLIQTVEEEPGNFKPVPSEVHRAGDLVRNYVKREQTQDSTNDNITLSNQISIVADSYLKAHLFEIAYVKFKVPQLGGIWKVTNAELVESRILLSFGGVYSGISVDTTRKT